MMKNKKWLIATPEKDILKVCLEWLTYNRVFHWRSNQAPIPLKDGGFRRFNGLKGVSDILGIVPDGSGRLLAIEVKRMGGKPSPEQTEFLQTVANLGGVACIVHSSEELEAELKPYLGRKL